MDIPSLDTLYLLAGIIGGLIGAITGPIALFLAYKERKERKKQEKKTGAKKVIKNSIEPWLESLRENKEKLDKSIAENYPKGLEVNSANPNASYNDSLFPPLNRLYVDSKEKKRCLRDIEKRKKAIKSEINSYNQKISEYRELWNKIKEQLEKKINRDDLKNIEQVYMEKEVETEEGPTVKKPEPVRTAEHIKRHDFQISRFILSPIILEVKEDSDWDKVTKKILDEEGGHLLEKFRKENEITEQLDQLEKYKNEIKEETGPLLEEMENIKNEYMELADLKPGDLIEEKENNRPSYPR